MRGWRQGLAVLVVTAAMAAPGLAQVKGGAPPMAGGPMMGAMGGDKPSAKTAALEKKADQLEVQYKKKPNAKLKLQLAQAKYEYGHARMFDSALSPRQKYRPALKAFREALKLNPGHKGAKEDKNAIEKVYKQMGMPIPQ